MKKWAPWEWGKTHQSAWIDLKTALANVPTLVPYDWNRAAILAVDGSTKAVGATLGQFDPEFEARSNFKEILSKSNTNENFNDSSQIIFDRVIFGPSN